MPHSNWFVHKFGGTSVGSSERYLNVSNLVSRYSGAVSPARTAVVVSAMAGITNALEACCRAATEAFFETREGEGGGGDGTGKGKDPRETSRASRLAAFEPLLEDVYERHRKTVSSLCDSGQMSAEEGFRICATIRANVDDLKDVMMAMAVSGSCPESLRELVMGHGELWSAQVLHAVMQHKASKQSADGDGEGGGSSSVAWIDAREVLVVDEDGGEGGGTAKFTTFERVFLNWKISQEKMDDWCQRHPEARVVIITG
uniref:Aspartate/glutamate/uridylate kinase domain-containing protein n=1 Tax=Chromera velia CCMP2878 TaxID=1169474 RepID=A0A0G4IFH1_9ALVE|eukprot:Cvel_14039.t1-p1 / transcript=Cvel_14039.t1 / gene=Cvel_14039 / organism=Chromera_velia_CCMP2878 / gene_product=Bifunctional aspartokinase/homoserine dehydrogenase, putative / transcript_product=Bifunctional aspartokinase/homoserine dehydrogenase, putative / location=Cvel_scaffold984:533-2038(-) / protein_length=257 / sequence_SO=supercontig / SO=protein_coding / is_pseudo=false